MKKDCTICAAKTKVLISCAVTAQLICGFVFAYANCCFSHAVAHVIDHPTFMAVSVKFIVTMISLAQRLTSLKTIILLVDLYF